MDSPEESRQGSVVPAPNRTSLVKLAALFLRLGLTAFGGPAAHIAMMQEELIERRRWLTKEQFLDLIGAANLLPGPSSTELAIYIGFRQAGWKGLFLAGSCFILPAFFIVIGIAWAYVRFGHLPQVTAVLYGVKPVVIAIVFQALWHLSRTAMKTRLLAGIGIVATISAFAGANPLLMLLGTGLLVGGGQWVVERKKGVGPFLVLMLFIVALMTIPLLFRKYIVASSALGLSSLFVVFVKLGSVVYGSGYVLLAFLRSDLVTQRGWLTSTQLLDAVAVGQVTPGPVFTTATFIGYILSGPVGALVATVGIFMPAFAFVAFSGPLVPRLRHSPIAGAFLDGVNVASMALMTAVTWELGRAAIVDLITAALVAISAGLLLRFRVNSAWLVLGGAVIGLTISALGIGGR
jgi:chromate transporter